MGWIMRRLQRDDRGFTLIELMVVVLIIAILIAIAIPTFLGARKRAQDRAAQASLRTTLTTSKTIYQDSEDFKAVTQAALQAAEPSLTYTATGATNSTGPTNMSINGDDGSAAGTASTVMRMAGLSKSGTCFYVRDSTSGPTEFYKKASAGSTCNANELTVTGAPGGTITSGW